MRGEYVTLPRGWRNGRERLLLPAAAFWATAAIAAVLAVRFLYRATVDDWTFVALAVPLGACSGLMALYALRISRHVASKARGHHRLGVDDAARAVEAFLAGRGVAHAETAHRPSRRVYELEGGRTTIEIVAYDPLLTWVLVGPVPDGEDLAFSALIEGLGEALDRAERPRAPRAR